MRHQETTDVFEAGSDVFSDLPQFFVLLIRYLWHKHQLHYYQLTLLVDISRTKLDNVFVTSISKETRMAAFLGMHDSPTKYTNAKRSIPAHPTFVNDTHRDLHL